MGEDSAADASRKSSKDGPQTAILACEACKARKIRCDNSTYPCAACRNSGRQCVAVVRPRLPRGRKGGRKETTSELKARINRLESLVQSMSDTIPTSSDASRRDKSRAGAAPPQPNPISSIPPAGSSRPGFSNRLGGELWETLASEVSGIRAVLEQPDDEENSSESSLHGSHQASTMDEQTYGNLLLNMARPDKFQFPEISAKHLHVFAGIFRFNIDPPTKLIYAPTFTAHLESGAPYYDYEPDNAALLALKASVFYACICSMTQAQCGELLGNDRDLLRDIWRAAAEGAMHKAEFLTTTDPTTLTAFVTYLLAFRSHNRGRLVWTLTALAIRVAQAMNLHREESLAHMPFFEAEMRRRLWFAILNLDLQGATDRGTEPMVHNFAYSTKPLTNLNDSDLQPGSGEQYASRVGFTDSTLACIFAKLASLARMINFVPPALLYTKDCPIYHWDWNERLWQTDWAPVVQGLLSPHSKPTTAYEHRCVNLIHGISATVTLFQYRPIQRHPALGPPPCDQDTILALATASLEGRDQVMRTSGANDPYAWCESGFVFWHPLAVVLAELCVDRDSDSDLVRRAWRIADKVYVEMSMKVAEGDSGPLWTPIKKLMRRATMKRPHALSPPEDSWRRLELQMQDFDVVSGGTSDVKMENTDLSQDPVQAMQLVAFDQMYENSVLSAGPTWSPGWTPETVQQNAWNSWGTFIEGIGQDPASLWLPPIPVPGAPPMQFSQSMQQQPAGAWPPL